MWNSTSTISVFQQYFASIDKIFISWGRLRTRLWFYDVLRFSWFPKIITFKSFDNSWKHSYITCLLLIVTHASLAVKRKSLKSLKILCPWLQIISITNYVWKIQKFLKTYYYFGWNSKCKESILPSNFDGQLSIILVAYLCLCVVAVA